MFLWERLEFNPSTTAGAEKCRDEEDVYPTKKFHALPFT
jgi:hypothetical protein